MSNKPELMADRMLAVLGMADLTPHEKVVGAALAWHDGPGGCHPSILTVSELVNLHRATVTRHMRSMKKKGRLSSKRRGQKFNYYVINYGVPDVAPVVTSEAVPDVALGDARCSTTVTSDVAPVATQTGIEQEYKQEGGALFEITKSDSNGSAVQDLENAHPANDKIKFFKCLDRVSAMTAGRPINSEGKEGLWQALQDHPMDRVIQALNNHVQNNKFFPCLSEIKTELIREERVEWAAKQADCQAIVDRYHVQCNDKVDDHMDDESINYYCNLLTELLGQCPTPDILEQAFIENDRLNGYWPTAERIACIILNQPQPQRRTTCM